MNRNLTRSQLKTLGLSSLGGMLEFYDFIIFIFYAHIISVQFFPDTLSDFWATLNSYGMFAAGYFARPLGGIFMAHFGDTSGRKKMFSLSILLMVIPTFAIGILPTFNQIGYAAPLLLLLIRVLQGIAIGGEVPGAWVFVAEHVNKNQLFTATAIISASLSFGILLGALVAMTFNQIYTEKELMDYAWRLPFILGGVFGFFAFFLRQWLNETPVFKEMQIKKTLSKKIPLQVIFSKHKWAVISSMLYTWMLTAYIVVLLLILPNLLTSQFGIDRNESVRLQCYAIFALSIGSVVAGYLCDKTSPNRIFIIFNLLMIPSVYLMFHLLIKGIPQWAYWYVITSFLGGIMGCIAGIMIRKFPPNIRFSGVSFSYNIAYAVFGGLTPVLIISLVQVQPIYVAYYLIGLACLILILSFLTRIKKSNEKYSELSSNVKVENE